MFGVCKGAVGDECELWFFRDGNNVAWRGGFFVVDDDVSVDDVLACLGWRARESFFVDECLESAIEQVFHVECKDVIKDCASRENADA